VTAADELKEKMAAFKEAVYGLRCVRCGRLDFMFPAKAHHVIYRQHLPVDKEWDPRNAMPVCNPCHERHHNASRRIPLTALSEENLEFASEVLGEAAEYYLARRYKTEEAA
jgi:5-methylcytosine-specific restriction endonuclease McrA